jgi:hypothetical protein
MATYPTETILESECDHEDDNPIEYAGDALARMTIDEAAVALTEHGLDQRETVNLAKALSMFHARNVADDREGFGALMFTVGLVAGLDHGANASKPSPASKSSSSRARSVEANTWHQITCR